MNSDSTMTHSQSISDKSQLTPVSSCSVVDTSSDVSAESTRPSSAASLRRGPRSPESPSPRSDNSCKIGFYSYRPATSTPILSRKSSIQSLSESFSSGMGKVSKSSSDLRTKVSRCASSLPFGHNRPRGFSYDRTHSINADVNADQASPPYGMVFFFHHLSSVS